MYYTQVLETGLINLLTYSEAHSRNLIFQGKFDELYQENEKLTFGKIIKRVSETGLVPATVMEKIRGIKADRDFLAHRFWRDRVIDLMTVDGRLAAVEELEGIRRRIVEVDQSVDNLIFGFLSEIGIDYQSHRHLIEDEMKAEAVARYP